MPLYDKKNPLAYLAVGCYLDDSPLEEQWAHTRGLLDWWPGDPDELKPAFFQFRQYSRQEVQAYAETLEALSAYIRLKGMILTTEQTDAQKLERKALPGVHLRAAAHRPHQAVQRGQGAVRGIHPLPPYCPAPHQCRQAPAAPEQSAHLRHRGGGGHQRLQLFFQSVPLCHRDHPQRLPEIGAQPSGAAEPG